MMSSSFDSQHEDSGRMILTRRPYLTDGFQLERRELSMQWESCVSSLSLAEQEDLLVDDLLYCMQGIEGRHIRLYSPVLSHPPLQINPHLDESIRVLTGRMVSVCGDYHALVQFVERTTVSNGAGAVRRAFAAAVRKILEEYELYVVQLEKCRMDEGLSLQKMWYHIQPIQRVLQALAECSRIIQQGNIRGGALLTYLRAKSEECSGDGKAHQMFTFLLQSASSPFFHQLERWLCHGELIGCIDDFMIICKEDGRERRASGAQFDQVNDWQRRYALKPAMRPSFLSSAAEKILNSGKYLNIIASCGEQVNLPSHTQLRYVPQDRRYLKAIDAIYAEAGRALVSMLIDRFGLLQRLRSLKHYFMIDRGDWLLHFMETAQMELDKPTKGVSLHRVENLLRLAFNLSSVANDPIKEEIGFEFVRRSLTEVVLEIVGIKGGLEPVKQCDGDTGAGGALYGQDAFAVRYDAGWPLSIVFHKDAMFKYQLIFRQLLTFKSIERRLSRAWISRRGDSRQAILLHKLATFGRKFLYHASVDVIEPYWHRFIQTVSTERQNRDSNGPFTLDDLLKEHDLFLDSCAADLLLTEETLIECVEKIVQLCKECIKCVELGEEAMDVEFMEQEYRATVEDLLSHIRSLSNSQREKNWLDVAYSLGLINL